MRLCLVIIFFSLCVSCQNLTYPDRPEVVFSKFVSAVSAGDIENASLYVSKDDQVELLSAIDIPEKREMMILMFSSMGWTLMNTYTGTDNAFIDIRYEMPDVGAIYGIILASRFGDTNCVSEKCIREIREEAFNKLRNGDVGMMKGLERRNFILEEGKWKLILKPQPLGAVKYVGDAMKYLIENNDDEARKLLEKALKIDPDNETAIGLLKMIDDSLKEKQRVMQNQKSSGSAQ